MDGERAGGARSGEAGGGCWPTREQVWLLRAALLRDQAALDAWRSWRASVGLERADRASQRLLPLAAHNLHQLGAQDDDLASLRAVHARVWADNRVRLHRLASVLSSLATAGIETMVLKGGALAALVYDDPGLRPMSDLDIAVPTAKALPALAVLAAGGWLAEGRPELALEVSHAAACSHERLGQLDLHWHVLSQGCTPAADRDFWNAAEHVTIAGAPTRVLCPADQLLHVVVHGVRWCPLPPFRWAADAVVLLRRAGETMDWERLAAQAAQRRLTLPVREGLEWLAHTLDAPVPAAALARLAAQPVSPFERAEFKITTRPWGTLGALPVHVFLNARIRGGLIRSLPHFPQYLQRLYGVDRVWRLPAALIARRGAKARSRRHASPGAPTRSA